MSIFLTGGTGFLGSYVLDTLLGDPSLLASEERVFVMTRSGGDAALEKLWRALQLHMDAERFYGLLDRIVFVPSDLMAPGLGLSEKARAQIVEECDSVLHIAASLNRKSSKACFNANLRGTLSIIQLVREIAERRGNFRRFSEVSTTAVAGKREHAVISEDEAVDWAVSDYDPYGRTKKFAEHMSRELLPDIDKCILRPPTVMGDSRFPETTQFEMARIYSLMVGAPAVPVHPDTRLDFVPANFVGPSIAKLHTKPTLRWDTYHLSAGEGAETAADHARALRDAGIGTPRFVPQLHGAFDFVASQLTHGPKNDLTLIASLIKVFLPYFTNDVVFDNRRVVEELGETPPPFTTYCAELVRWTRSVRFSYPYSPLPERRAVAEAAE